MSFWRALPARLALWYSILLMAGLLSLGAALWIGIQRSMTSALDGLLVAQAKSLESTFAKEFGDGFPDWPAGRDDGEVKALVEDVDPAQAWFVLHGARVAVNGDTGYEGLRRGSLQSGQYVEVAVVRAGAGWLAEEISLESGFDAVFEEELYEYLSSASRGQWMGVRDAGGRRYSLDGRLAPWEAAASAAGEFSSLETGAVQHRVLGRETKLAGRLCTVYVATPLYAVAATQNRLWHWGLWVIPVALLLSLGGGWWISRQALQPVEAMVNSAARMDVDHLAERLPVPPTGDVVQRMAVTFNATLDRLEHSVHRLEEFTADVSHELRSPVSVIRTTADLALRHPRTDTELREDLGTIQAEAVRLTELIEDLLTLARSGSGADSAPMKRVRLDELARDVGQQFATGAAERDLSLDVEEASITGHERSLRRLIVILVDNAFRHTPPDAAVQVVIRRTGNSAAITVRDTGDGIPPDVLPRIFDRFYRADAARSRANGSFGLGLSIAKWIAESHGGSIRATTELGKGSEFRVTLPRGGGPPETSGGAKS